MRIKSRIAILLFVVSVIAVYNFVSIRTYEDVINTNLCTEVKLPIVMYHAFLKDASRHGKFIISPEQFEEDIKYIKDKGYSPIHIKELITYVNGEGNLPEKPILITIDDGYYNNYIYAFPILKQYGMKAVISPIMKFSELYSQHDENNAYYSHITFSQAREMAATGLVEFQNHSYDMHKESGERHGVRKTDAESVEEYRKTVYADLYRAHNMIKENIGCTPGAFVFPFGSYNPYIDQVIDQMGYSVTLSCESGINSISKGCSLKNLKRFNRPHGISTTEFFAKILE